MGIHSVLGESVESPTPTGDSHPPSTSNSFHGVYPPRCTPSCQILPPQTCKDLCQDRAALSLRIPSGFRVRTRGGLPASSERESSPCATCPIDRWLHFYTY